jgi:hypothetical protein
MHARLTTIVFADGQSVDAEEIFRQVLPAVEDLDGFNGIMIFSNEEPTTILALTLWETAEALAAAAPVLEGIKRAETAFRTVEAKQTVRLHVAGCKLEL